MTETLNTSIIPFTRRTRQVWLSMSLSALVALSPLTLPGKAQAYHRRDWRAHGDSFRYACPIPRKRSFPRDFMGEHYSPEENLEAIDVAMIDRAKKTIDIAMYAFTDRAIAEAAIRAAKRGVRIRIYRDRIQVHDRGDKTRRLLETRAGQTHITVLVKRNSSRNIMHLKSYLIDGSILRTGSANWSPPGEGAYCRRGDRPHRAQQDNNLFLTMDRKEISKFEKTFDRIYSRDSNTPWSPRMMRKRDIRRNPQ